ncbi:MAG: 16S rRNA processing protein RimM [Gammaproteobacteria bacterium RIFCSPHIGHO2_12_FULL_43_28]|nr:MAG: 16S rRNA processing protein RimM [Gammaproteobacteria bacterium RIFCSPHIGHO2_12_FULL_43_28]
MANSDSAHITIGKIGSTFGVRGWVKIFSYTEPYSRILDYSPWYLTDSAGKHTLITVDGGELRHNHVVAKLAGYENPEEARALTGKTITIARSQLPALANDEYYWADLKGLTVINQTGMTLGIVTDLIETGANDVLIIKGAEDKKEHGIPYLPGSIIKDINLEKKIIQVDWELI